MSDSAVGFLRALIGITVIGVVISLVTKTPPKPVEIEREVEIKPATQKTEEEQRRDAERNGDLPPRRNLNGEAYTPQREKSKAQADYERGVQENIQVWTGQIQD